MHRSQQFCFESYKIDHLSCFKLSCNLKGLQTHVSFIPDKKSILYVSNTALLCLLRHFL